MTEWDFFSVYFFDAQFYIKSTEMNIDIESALDSQTVEPRMAIVIYICTHVILGLGTLC